MKNLLCFVTFFFILAISSCSKNDSNSTPAPVNPNINFTATLSGASEVPANTSTATGNASLTFNNNSKILTITVNYSGITATGAHIHKAAVGSSGPVVFGFSNITSPINYTSVALDAAQEADLKANLYYVNIHSTAFPAGEIRGQLIMQTSSGGGGGGSGGGGGY